MAYIRYAVIKIHPVVFAVLDIYRFSSSISEQIAICVQQYPAEPGHGDDITEGSGCRAFPAEQTKSRYENGWPPIYLITSIDRSGNKITLEVHPDWIELAKRDNDPRVTRKSKPSPIPGISIFEEQKGD